MVETSKFSKFSALDQLQTPCQGPLIRASQCKLRFKGTSYSLCLQGTGSPITHHGMSTCLTSVVRSSLQCLWHASKWCQWGSFLLNSQSIKGAWEVNSWLPSGACAVSPGRCPLAVCESLMHCPDVRYKGYLPGDLALWHLGDRYTCLM